MTDKSGRRSFRERLDHMVGQLRKEIHTGNLQPGDFLPAESTLAEKYNLSNKSVRKGLDMLVQDGLIVKIDRVGSKVKDVASGKVRIHFGYNASLTKDFVLDELIRAFHARYPDIHVQTIALNEMDTFNSAVELMANKMVDAVSLNSSQFQEFVDAELTGLLEEMEPGEGLYPIANEAFAYDGKQYALPISFSPVIICYNKAHFREAGLAEPDSYWTWEHLMDAAAQLSKRRGRHAIYFVPASENRYSVFLLQSGIGMARDEHGQRSLGAATAGSLQAYSKLVNNHQIFPKYLAGNHEDVTTSLFIQEQVSMIMATYYNLNDFKSLPLDYDLAPLPTLKLRDPQRTLLLTIGAAVVASSQQREEAKLFIRFLASPEAQNIIREQTVSIPAHKAIAEREVHNDLNRPDRYLMYRELFPTFSYHKDLGVPIAVLKSFRMLLNAYWSNLIDEGTLYKEMAALIPQSFPTTET